MFLYLPWLPVTSPHSSVQNSSSPASIPNSPCSITPHYALTPPHTREKCLSIVTSTCTGSRLAPISRLYAALSPTYTSSVTYPIGARSDSSKDSCGKELGFGIWWLGCIPRNCIPSAPSFKYLISSVAVLGVGSFISPLQLSTLIASPELRQFRKVVTFVRFDMVNLQAVLIRSPVECNITSFPLNARNRIA